MKINLKEDKDRIPELIAQSFSLGDISNWTEQDCLDQIEIHQNIIKQADDILDMLDRISKNG